MTRPEQPLLRPVLLAASAAAAVTCGHLLDALSLLPGVHESAAVRTAVLAPASIAPTAAGAAVLAVGVDRLLRLDRARCALAALVGGQTALLGAPEVLGRVEAGDGDHWGALALAVALQVALAAVTVTVALVVSDRLLRLPGRALRADGRAAVAGAPHPTVVLPALLAGGVRGRGPPVPVLS